MLFWYSGLCALLYNIRIILFFLNKQACIDVLASLSANCEAFYKGPSLGQSSVLRRRRKKKQRGLGEDNMTIFNSRFGFDPALRLCSHNVYSQYRNSLSSWVLVLESLSSPLEEQSEEVERLQVSWEVKTIHRMRGRCRKRKGVTQSSFTWRNSRRIPPGASGGHWTGGEEVTAYVEGWSGTLHVAQLTDQRPNKTYHHTVKPSNNTRKRTNTFSHPPLTSEKLPTQCQTYQQPQKTSQHAVKPTNNPRKHTKTVSYLPTTPEILLTLWKLTNSISTNVLGRGSTPVRWVLVFFSALCKL